MKVLHVVAGDLRFGAARGAFNLHIGLRELGVESFLVYNGAGKAKEWTVNTNKSNKNKIVDKVRSNVNKLLVQRYKNRADRIFSTGLVGYDITKLAVFKEADIIHFHWINSGFINIKLFSKINKPIIWTVRDMWAFTGGCHYSLGCTNYEEGCGNCPQLNSGRKKDLSNFVYKRKEKYIPESVKLVGISPWVSKTAQKSQIFKNFDIRTISNCIDVKEFFPVNKEIARDILGIKTTKKIILAGAINLNAPYKGFHKYLEALDNLNRDKYRLYFFGRLSDSSLVNLGFEYHSLGFLHDNISLRLLYSAADVFVFPSTMEAFGKTLVEAMACGTPSVCFDATGPEHIIEHQIDGYKAVLNDSNDFAKGIEWIVDNKNYDLLAKNAQRKVEEEFDVKIAAERYYNLYNEVY